MGRRRAHPPVPIFSQYLREFTLSPHAQTARLVEPSPRREIARIAVPVSAEFVLTLVLNVVNQIVVGTLGATAIAAVGFANSLTMILVLTLGAIGASVSILVARAHGGGDQTKLNQTVSAALFLAGGVSVLAAVPILVWGEPLMRLVGASETVAAAGGGLPQPRRARGRPDVIGALFSGVLRSTGRPRSPMVATMATVGLNAALAYLFVTGTGPFPGSASLAPVSPRSSRRPSRPGSSRCRSSGSTGSSGGSRRPGMRRGGASPGPLVVLALPLGITELFWTSGTFLYNVVFQQISDDALAAAQIVNMLESLFLVGSIGLMAATTALVGREVGRGDGRGAAAWVRRIKKTGTVTGVAFGVLYGATALVLPFLFHDTTDEVRHDGDGRDRPVCDLPGRQGPQHDPRGRGAAERRRRPWRDLRGRRRSVRRRAAARGGPRPAHPAGRRRRLRGAGHRGAGQGRHLLAADAPGPVGQGRGEICADGASSAAAGRSRGRRAGAARLISPWTR